MEPQEASLSVTIDKALITSLVDKAADLFIGDCSPDLSTAVADAIGDVPFNEDQVARIAQATNQTVWARLSSSRKPCTVRFEPAIVEVIMEKTKGAPEKTKTANRDMRWATGPQNHFEDLVGAVLEKTAAKSKKPSVKKQTKMRSITPNYWRARNLRRKGSQAPGAPPTKTPEIKRAAQLLPDTQSSWGRIIEQLKTAQDELELRLHKHEQNFEEELSALSKTASDLLYDGISQETVEKAVLASADEQTGPALVAWLQKHAFPKHPVFRDEFSFFDKKAQQVYGNVTVWDPISLEKTAEADDVEEFDSTALNPDHPLVKAAESLCGFRVEGQRASVAIEKIQQRIKEASDLKQAGIEVPFHASVGHS